MKQEGRNTVFKYQWNVFASSNRKLREPWFKQMGIFFSHRIGSPEVDNLGLMQ